MVDVGVVRGLVRDLGVAGRGEGAAEALVALGGGAVEGLVRELANEESSVDWRPLAAVLGRVGGAAAFDGVLRGLASAVGEGSRRRPGFAFSGFGAAALDRCTAALSHPAPHVRLAAVRGLQRCGDGARSVVTELLPLLGDPDHEVGREAQHALVLQGEHVVPLLRRIRERGPGRLRARALTVLAELGGETALSRADVAAIERLVRVKLPDDRPEGMWACWNHWIAVPGGDRAGIMRTLGLVDPRPVTFALGNDIVDSDSHGFGPEDPYDGYERVFVTPELDGWTLVLGAWCDPCGEERRDDVLRLCTELSARYGRAHAYYYGGQGDG
ncbi:HEAT repeat domain-containing protein [Streptomyces maremycinicus]|uniref:HEAT repeat domain-containing protein n=1 Tax=Streptomyces maremycinicus TaxID=1679753 RepID=UPI000AED3B1A|nr:HEAT repeat domain-containing protein [Streptomyces sp. NBRC 110468]